MPRSARWTFPPTMTKSLLLLSATALALTACHAGEKPANEAAAANSTSAADAGADEQAIRGQVDHWLQLVKAKDAAAIAGLYAEDGAVMPPNGPIGKGRTAIQQTWASMMGTPGFDLTFTPEQILVSSSGDMIDRTEDEAKNIRRRWGILFQNGALFSTLTVAENVEVPIREYFPYLKPPLLDEIASYKIAMGGLPPDAGPKFPSELSGGMAGT